VIGYDDATYKSESSSAARNWCLAYMMLERQAYPPCFTTLSDTLELYFQICSIQSTCVGMSTLAATLANGGLNPLTGDRVFKADDVRHVLPIMLMNGMYDFSGQWAYDIGVPAKSGVGGCVYIVIPNVCGIAIWSPRLDAVGNSVRAVQAAKLLTQRFAFHNFEVFSGLVQTKLDPTLPKSSGKQKQLSELLFAASQGDPAALEQQYQAGVDLFAVDYDKRGALHLAGTEGHVEIAQFLIHHAADKTKLSPKDRWGGTPLSDAIYFGHEDVAAVLRDAGAEEGSHIYPPRAIGVGTGTGLGATPEKEEDSGEGMISPEAPRMLFAAAAGDLDEMIKIVAEGQLDIAVCDYDKRTALHLAASNGNMQIIKYLFAQCANAEERRKLLEVEDRWGHTAHDDAIREKHPHCAAALLAPKRAIARWGTLRGNRQEDDAVQ